MKKIAFLFIGSAICASSWAQTLDRSIKPKPGPAPQITLGKSTNFTLPNGLRVYVVENHKLPVFSCSIQLDIRPELEGNQAGYRDMMSELLVAGTKSRSKDKLNLEIDQMGATIRANSESLYGRGLKKNFSKILDLMADIAMNTEVKQEELDKVKKMALSALETEKNEPKAMVRNISAVVNFSSAHPYGEIPTDETIKNIDANVCNKYISTYFRPNVAYMAIVGDVTMAEIKPIIEKAFGKWAKKDVPVKSYPMPTANGQRTKVAFAPRVGAVQSVVEVTYPVDLKPGTSDAIKARVANSILGGGSQGRLFLDLREKHAWTYGAYSSLQEDILVGSFSSTVQCRNAVSDSAIEAILTQMKLMQEEKVSDTTLANAINYLSGSFAIGLEDPSRVAQYAINIERYKMPKDFYENYLKNLSAVTAADVQEISKKYIDPDHANIVVAGSKENVADKLKRFSADGKIEYYNSFGKTIVPSEMQQVSADVTPEKVYQRYLDAIGGEKAIKGLKDIKTVSKGEMQGIAITITEVKKAPNMIMTEISGVINGKSMTFQKQAFDGTNGYLEAQGSRKPVTGDDLEALKEEADMYAELTPEKQGIKRAVKGKETIDGTEVYVLTATDRKNKATTEYYDVKTGFLVRKIESVEGPKGPVNQITDYKDYKEVAGTGYKLAHTVGQSGGGFDIVAKVELVEVNKNIADTIFK